jgi:hypothetical protein
VVQVSVVRWRIPAWCPKLQVADAQLSAVLLVLSHSFHLIQAQRKIIQRKTDAGSGKGKKKKKKPTGEKRLPGLGEGDHADLDEVDFDHLEWWEQSLYAQTTDMLAEEERALEEMERKRSQGRAISQQLDPSISALSSTASQSTADAESGLRSREHYIAEFTSAEALARRVDNFTTSLQDSELMLRLLGEIAPQVADMDMLTHIDLGSRARLLIRMLEKLNPDHAGMVTSLDFVHAFSSDRVAGLLARLMVDFPGVPIQGCWFDRGDYVNRSTVKPFLMHTNVKTLEEQMASTGTRMNGVRTERNEEFEEEFGPLAQLSHEIVQLQHAIQKRARIIPVHMTELHSVLKNTLACGRRILDDAYARHDLWLSTKTRLKAFVTAIFVAHVRGRPLKLDDPRAMKEREVFCALLENPLDAVWRKQKEKEDATLRELTTSLKRQENIAQMHKVPSTGSLPRAPSHMHTPSEVPLSPRSVNNPKLQLALDRWVTTKATAATEEITAAAGAKQDDHIPATPAVEEVLPHGKPQARFWDMLEGENKTVFMIESEEAGATDGSSAAESTLKFPPPTESPLATLSFELHVCQNLLLLFYEPLKQIWSAYAQADANAASGIEGANTMNLLEFWQLVKDCGLTAPGVFTPKQVEQVFLEVFMTREEKKDKLGTMAGGTMHALHAVILDPITGVAQPPKSKDQLELSEIDFIEVLLRISYLRKWKNPQEKQAVVAEWRSFQRERVRQLEREQRERNQAKRASQEGGCEGEIDLEKDLENDLEWEGASAQGDPTAAAALSSELSLTSDPLSDTLTGKDHSFNANMHDGLNSSFFAAAGDYRESVDETYNLDFSDPSKLPSLHLGLSLRFFGLLKCRLLPKANKIDADTFRAAYKTAGVSKLFRKHGNVLRKLFFRYATLHSVKVSVLDGAQADSWANTIDYAEFGTLLKDLHLVVDHSSGLGGKEASKMLLTPEQCYSLFALAQQELHVANTAVVSKSVEKSRYGSEQLAAAEEEKQRALEKERKKREKEKAAKESKEKEANASSKKKKKRRTTSKASISSLPSPSSTNSKRSSKRATLDKPLKLTEASGSNRRSMRMSMKQEDLAKLTKRGSMQSTADAADATSEEAPAKARTPTKLTIMPSTRDSSDDDDGASIMSEDTEDGNGSEASRESSQIGSTTAALRSEKRGRRSSKRSSFSSRASATSNPAERSDPEEKDEAEKEQEDLHVDHSAIQILAPAMSDGRIMSNGAASPEAPSADVDLDAQAASTAALAGGGAAAAVLHTHSADHSEMIYPEFLEALAAIGSFRYPNPYRSAAERIEMFLDIDVLPFVPKLLKRARTEVSEELTATTKSPFY